MIKLTRGALTMLLAQYRGILKNAWIKNFAVAAALATSVTSAYAEDVTTWEQATSKDVVLDGKPHGEDAAAYTGTLNLQSDVVIKGAQQITITGGADHKIGASDQDKNITIDAKDEASYANLTINGKESAATLTIDSNKTKDAAKTTSIWLNEVKVGVEGEKTATLNVNNSPAWIANETNFVEDKGDYTEIDSLEIGRQGTVEVADKAELDVSDKLTIAEGGNLNNNSHLWLGRDKETGIATEVKVYGNLTSTGKLYLDSKKLTVGKNDSVTVKGILGLNNVDSVNINDLTIGDEAKITLNGDTQVGANTLVLDAKHNYVKSVTAADLTLGSDKYDNSGLAVNATVTTKLTAKAAADLEKNPQAYKIKNGETIGLNAVAVNPGFSIGNETGVGTVASDLEVAGGALNVQAGTWNAEGLTVTLGTASVESNAALALKTLEIANGQTLSVATKGGQQDDVAGVLDLTKTNLVNATGKDASEIKGTIANAGVVKITGDKLNAAIANVKDDEKPENNNYGYIFNNTGVIEVTTPATLATGAFITGTENPKVAGIKNEGTLAVGGALTVNGETGKASSLVNAGTIKAASLQLNGKAGDPNKDADKDNSVFTLGDTNDKFDIDGAVTTNTDKLVIAGTVNAQSIGGRILEITGTAGADADHKVGTITAAEIDLSGTVNAGNVEATKDLTVTDGSTTVEGVLTAAKFTQTGGTVTVKKGAFNVSGDANVKGTTLDGATANIGTLKATTASALDLTKGSNASVDAFDGTNAAENTVTIDKDSTLTITATTDKKDETVLFANKDGKAITGEGTLAVNANALGLKQNITKDDYVATNKFAEKSVGVLKINGAASAIGADKINGINLGKLVKALSVSGGNDFGGKLQLDGVTADIGKAEETTNAKNGSYKQANVQAFAQLAGDTTLQSVTVDAGNGTTTAVSGDLGNLVADKGTTSVLIAEATLQGSGSSTATNGYYVSALKDDAKKVELAGAKLANDKSSLTLAGAGKIGAVTAGSNGQGTLAVTGNANVVEVDTNGKEVATDIGATGIALEKVNVSGALTAKDIFTNDLESSGSVVAAKIEAGKATVEGGVVNATNLKTSEGATIKAGSVNVGEATVDGVFTMDGGALTATAVKDGPTGKVTLGNKAYINAGSISAMEIEVTGALTSAGNITADTLTAQSAVDLTGGVVNAKKVSLTGTTTIKSNASLIAGDLTATGQTITVGEEGDEGSAGFLFAKDIKGAGKIVIDPEFSQGVALGGTTAFADSNELTTDIIVGKNAIFAYDENLTVEQLKSLASKYTLSDAENGVGSLLVVNSAIDLGAKGINVGKDQAAPSSPAPTNGKLLLGQNAALAVGGTALANAKVNANNTQEAAVTANNGVQYTDSAKVLLDGPVKAGAQYQIFKAGTNGVKNEDTSSGKKLTASSLNGFYTATIGDDGQTTKVAANRSVLSQLTTPLYEHLLAVTGNGNKGAGVQFLEKVASESLDGGKDAETVARLGAFGGLYNAAYNVNKTSADAIAARTAMGNNGVQQVATNNAIGGAVWLSPIYKNVKADSLESDGKESGADVKLTGVALGADVTTANNVRLGAMFNLGSGDTDGNKLGSRAENDFDYFGFGVYAAYNYGNFGVAADATYAKVDNDLSASSSLGYGYFKSSVDTNVYSLGLTAKYAFDTNFATITPHAGIRYTSLNADSYDVESAYGTLATTSYDSASVVSFPVGVTFTKDIKVNAWKVQPTFDVTLTANAGDTEAEYDTYFTGADSKVKLESEFVDSFTYGLTAGFEAQHESGVALGLGVNYEGSSNTNSYGVTGNVRYTF